ncbi:MAG: hypothetical protein U0Q16_09500 [Bryobacteraceae bacterium]
MLTAVSLLLAIQTFRWQQASKADEYSWKRQDLALSLLRDWDDKTTVHRQRIDLLQARLQGIRISTESDIPPMATELADAVWKQVSFTEGKQKEKDLYDLRNECISLLNYFESLAVAYYISAANQELLRVSAGPPLRGWYKRLYPFTAVADKAKNAKVWEPFYLLAKDLETEPDVRKKLDQAVVFQTTEPKRLHEPWPTRN